MPDIFTAEKRSEIMSRIRSSGTAPEQRMMAILQELVGGGRVNSQPLEVAGKPDFVIDDLRIAIFVDGCFYHSCPKHGRVPGSNQEYWAPKLLRTQRRDVRNRRQLRENGWSVWRVWEHDLRGRRAEATALKLERRISKRQSKVAP